MNSKYMIDAVTTNTGNVITYKIYKRKSFLFFGWWCFMCNEGLYSSAEELVDNLSRINNF